VRRLALLPLVLLAACSSGLDQPDAQDFTDGTCRAVAPGVLELGKTLDALKGKGDKAPSKEQRTALKTAQDQVRAVPAATDTALAATVQQLVTDVGIVRLRADTNTYEKALATTAFASYQKLLAACTP
jgi:hypothetical protein